MNVLSIPSSIWIAHILPYMPVRKTRLICRTLCDWMDPRIRWTYPVAAHGACLDRLLRRNPKYVHFGGDNCNRTIMNHALERLETSNLETVVYASVCMTWVLKEDLTRMLIILNKCKNLRRLKWEVGMIDMEVSFDWATQDFCRRITDLRTSTICPIRFMPALKHLTLLSDNLDFPADYTDLRELSESIRCNNAIETITISGESSYAVDNSDPDRVARYLARIVHKCARLKHVRILGTLVNAGKFMRMTKKPKGGSSNVVIDCVTRIRIVC